MEQRCYFTPLRTFCCCCLRWSFSLINSSSAYSSVSHSSRKKLISWFLSIFYRFWTAAGHTDKPLIGFPCAEAWKMLWASTRNGNGVISLQTQGDIAAPVTLNSHFHGYVLNYKSWKLIFLDGSLISRKNYYLLQASVRVDFSSPIHVHLHGQTLNHVRMIQVLYNHIAS